MTGSTGAVVLAAGGGSRFRGGAHKLRAVVRGRPMFEHAVGAAVESGIGPVVVVLGAEPLDVPDAVDVVLNDEWEDGLATSLTAGVDWARARGLDAVVVGLADQPGVTAEAWRLVAGAPAGAPVAVATYDGVRGHPVRLAASVWDRLPDTGDAGARALLAGGDVEVAEVPCPGSAADVDTVEDLAQWS